MKGIGRVVAERNLCVKEGERILVVTDRKKEGMAREFAEGMDADIAVFEGLERHGQEPPAWIAERLVSADVFMLITEMSLSHTRARVGATERGARGFSSPGLTAEMEGAMLEDPEEMHRRNGELMDAFRGRERVKIEAEGLSLEFSVAGRKWVSDDGLLCKPGSFGNLPAGEIFIAPVEGTGEGDIVARIGEEKGVLHISNGRIVGAEGMDGLMEMLGEGKGRMLAEFGIGTNRKARICGNILMDEKVAGTCHIAFGTNASFGGNIDAGVHVDVIIEKPSIYADGVPVMEEGILK